MSKGDTTVHVDFEVGGASAAKMTVMDIYRAQQANASKVNDAARALSKEQNITFSEAKKALREWVRMQNQALNQEAAAQKAAESKATADAAAAARKEEAIEKDRARKEEKIRDEERRAQRRAAERAVDDAKWEAREKIKEAKRVAREKERDLKLEQSQRGSINRLVGRGIWGAAMGVAGYAGVAGISNIISGISQGLEDIAEQGSALEKAITPLISLGDNVNKMAEMRTEVIGLGATMGRDNQDIANFLESLESLSNTMAADTLRDIKRETIQLTELAGGDLQTNMRMLAKANETYGDSFKTINQEQNKLFKIQQDADVPMAEMAYRMPELMASAKQLGFSFDEVGAGVIATTVALGRSEGAFTGLRNVFAALEEAPKKGIELQGTMVEQLIQLRDAADQGKISLLDLFGRDPLAAGGALLERIDSVRENINMLANMGPEGDVVGANLEQKYKDPKFVKARIYDLDKALMANSANIAQNAGSDNILTRAMERYRTGYHAGSEFGGDFPLFARFSGFAGMLGVDSVLEQGERVRLENVSEGSPLRTKLLEKQFNDQKARDLANIDSLRKNNPNQILFAGRPELDDMAEARAVKNRRFDPATASAAEPSLEKSLDLAAKIDESNRILRDIRDGFVPRSANVVKPGGGKTNNTETR